MMHAKLFLMPGLLGLAVLDAATLGLPTVTTDYPWHSPEIAYLQNEVNGIKVTPYEDVTSYSRAVVDLLSDRGERRLKSMITEVSQLAQSHTIEKMAFNFTAGVKDALRIC